VITPLERILEKFRAQYPQGCLIADVVSMHDGHYVVRAAVVQKGETLATGLSASADVQLAEDQARLRAIAALGIADESTAPSATQPAIQPATQPVAQPAIAANQSSQHSAPSSAPNLTSTDEADEFFPIDSIDLPEEDLSLPIDGILESPEQPSPAAPSLSTAASAIALENYSASPYPVDLSDVIAQTDVELTRLGWTPAQGREYLEKTYGKRSRQQLTDEELMSFLLYLEEH
jgi:hypothetical protein